MSKYEFSCSVYMEAHGMDVYSNGHAHELLSEGDFIPLIPEYRCETTPANSGFVVELEFGDPFSLTTSDDHRLWHIRGSEEELRAGNTVPYLLHFILEIQRMHRCQVTMHGAGVAKDGEAILILGKQGSGKTSLCLELCRRHGYSLIGNDLVLLGLDGNQCHLYGGTKIFCLRRATIARHNTDLQWLFKGVPDKDDWTTVTTATPDMIGVDVVTSPVPLQQIVYVHLLNDSLHPLHTAPVERMFSRLYLHEESSRYIRGVCFPMFVGKNLDYGTYIPSLDSVHFHNQRKKLIAWIQNHPRYRYVSGPMDELCAYLIRDARVRKGMVAQPQQRKSDLPTMVSLTAVPNIPMVQHGDSIGRLIPKALREAKIPLREHDVLVVASKIVSRAEERVVRLDTVTASEKAQGIANASGKDPRIVELMLQESRAILKVKPGVVTTVHRLGFVCTSAGIDKANVDEGTVSLLPDDPDRSALEIRRHIMEETGLTVAVVINDSFGVEYRAGSIGMAIGVAGIPALLRGGLDEKDLYGRKRNVNISFADEISAAASLLMGQGAAGVPLVVLSGLQYPVTEDSKIADLVVFDQIDADLTDKKDQPPAKD